MLFYFYTKPAAETIFGLRFPWRAGAVGTGEATSGQQTLPETQWLDRTTEVYFFLTLRVCQGTVENSVPCALIQGPRGKGLPLSSASETGQRAQTSKRCRNRQWVV